VLVMSHVLAMALSDAQFTLKFLIAASGNGFDEVRAWHAKTCTFQLCSCLFKLLELA
jgi:hypothetical protein